MNYNYKMQTLPTHLSGAVATVVTVCGRVGARSAAFSVASVGHTVGVIVGRVKIWTLTIPR